jgi:hypothetical protein
MERWIYEKISYGADGYCRIVFAVSAWSGIFTDAGTERTVENIYGQQVVLYGNGIYADNS